MSSIRSRSVVAGWGAAAILALSACGGPAVPSPGAPIPTPTTLPSVPPSTPPPSSTAASPGSTPDGSASPTGSAAATTEPAADGVGPAVCGPVQLPSSGATQDLVAVPGDGGDRVGCTEAFNVYAAFTALPPEQLAQASLQSVDVGDGWSCTIDDGATAAVQCVSDRIAQGRYGRLFETRAPA